MFVRKTCINNIVKVSESQKNNIKKHFDCGGVIYVKFGTV